MSLDALVAEMDAAGVSHAVVHAEYEYGDPADDLNEAVAALVAKMPDRFSGYGTVSLAPLRVMRAAAQVTRSAQLGLRGINIQPSFFGMPIDHPQLYPVYAKACELGLGAGVHTGINYTSHLPIKHDHPLQLDQVACDFPELTRSRHETGKHGRDWQDMVGEARPLRRRRPRIPHPQHSF